MIHLNCPSCRQPLSIPQEYAGQRGRCNYCGSPIAVPAHGFEAERELETPVAPDHLYIAPRRPARPGAGMLANEAERENGGIGASLGRIIVLGIVLLGVAACVLPALVIGSSARAPEPEPERPRILPSTRGGGKGVAPNVKGPDGASPGVPSPSEGSNPPRDQRAAEVHSEEPASELVYVSRTGNRYHKVGCPHLSEGSVPLSRREARARGLVPCKTCGG